MDRVMKRGWCVVRGALGPALSAILLAYWPAGPLSAQRAPLEDNSFLVEEAYNQPAREVQHVFTTEVLHGAQVVGFGQEWPLGGLRHQLSYGVAALNDLEFTFGDAEVSYRYQALGMQGGSVFMAPRVGALIPLGDAGQMEGNGGWGAELQIPVSWEVSKFLSLHGNVGATWRPDAEGVDGSTAATLDRAVGVSAVVFVASRFNLMAESVWERGEVVVGGEASGDTQQKVALGARAGFDLSNGLQIVPGVAWMPAVGDAPTRSFFYLSFEHGF